MSFSMMRLNLVLVYQRWEAEIRRRRLASNKLTGVSPDSYRVRLALPEVHGMPSHVTRILGKVCFSCHSVSAVRHKFCEHCGAPLFRPALQENRPSA